MLPGAALHFFKNKKELQSAQIDIKKGIFREKAVSMKGWLIFYLYINTQWHPFKVPGREESKKANSFGDTNIDFSVR
jgi:hypothetical protein